MKKISRYITFILAAVFFLTGVPAVSALAEEEIPAAVSETSVSEPAGEAPDLNVAVQPEADPEAVSEIPSGEDPAVSVLPEAVPETIPETIPETVPETGSEQSSEEENLPQLTEEPGAEITEPEETVTDEAALSLEEDGAEGEETDPSKEVKDPEEETKDPSEDEKPEEKPEKEKNEKISLSVTNNTNMFKVVKAYITTENKKRELVVALSGQSYDNLYVGTFEQAAAVGYDPSAWIRYFKDEDGNKAFRIPIDESTAYLPIISISNTYLDGYLQKKNSLARAFYARQFSLNQKKKTLVSGDYEYSRELTVKNKVKSFKVDGASLYTLGGPNNNGYRADLLVRMGSDAYDAAFVGSRKQAAKAEKTLTIGEDRLLTVPMKWLTVFGDPDSLQTLIGKEFTVSFHHKEKAKWIERVFKISEKKGVLSIDIKDKSKPSSGTEDIPVIPGQGDEEEHEPTIGGGTAAVDNSTGLKDGTYTPDKFSFSGGTGKIVITCSKVEVKGGKAYATIVFSNTKSGTAEFSYVKANGQTYNCTQAGGQSVATIPVEMNANTQILGMTTKMSAAHEIAYTIFVYIAGADAKKTDDLTKNKDFDEEAPVIAGLEAAGEEKVEEAEYFKVFNYSDGIRLLEVDMRIPGEKTNKEEKKSEEKEAEGTVTVIDEETGEEITLPADKGAAQTKLYKGNIIKYLLVPENVEIPAGLDKETIVIQLSVKSAYAGSEDIKKTMEELGAGGLITCTEKGDGKNVEEAGPFGDLNLRALVKAKCDLVMIPGKFLKEKDAKETFASQAEDLANLDIVLITDRSSDEKTDKARAEWLKVYGMLFGCEEAAEQAYNAVS